MWNSLYHLQNISYKGSYGKLFYLHAFPHLWAFIYIISQIKERRKRRQYMEFASKLFRRRFCVSIWSMLPFFIFVFVCLSSFGSFPSIYSDITSMITAQCLIRIILSLSYSPFLFLFHRQCNLPCATNRQMLRYLPIFYVNTLYEISECFLISQRLPSFSKT